MNIVALLKPIVSRMPLYVKLMYMLYADPAISRRRKACLSVALLYTISPLDLVPGFIPVVGQLDDIVIALSALLRELKKLPPDKRDEYLGKVHLRLETVEKDLDAAKTLMLYIATRLVGLLRKGAAWVGDRAFTLAVKGYLKYRMYSRSSPCHAEVDQRAVSREMTGQHEESGPLHAIPSRRRILPKVGFRR